MRPISFILINTSFWVIVSYGTDWTSCYDGYCYHRSPNTLAKWSECRAYCASLGTDLVSIHSTEENTFIYSNVCGQNNECAIGLNDVETTTVWKWADGSAVDYTNWCSNEPNDASHHWVYFLWYNDCWHDYSDTDHVPAYALCKRMGTLPSTTPSTLPSTSPTIGPSTTTTPSTLPSISPTIRPSTTTTPSTLPSISPTTGPSTTTTPSTLPSISPTIGPSTTTMPSTLPSISPTAGPSTVLPSNNPTEGPSTSPTFNPTVTVFPESSKEVDGMIHVLGMSMTFETSIVLVILSNLVCCLLCFIICACWWLNRRNSHGVIMGNRLEAVNMSRLERLRDQQWYTKDHAYEGAEMSKPSEILQPTLTAD